MYKPLIKQELNVQLYVNLLELHPKWLTSSDKEAQVRVIYLYFVDQ